VAAFVGRLPDVGNRELGIDVTRATTVHVVVV
jgi:hypothetical protein